MAVAFWSIELKKGQKEEVQPPEGYVLNLQLAALGSAGSAIVKVHTQSIEGDELNSVICTLREKSCDQYTMNLVFGYDVPTSFSYTGEAKSVFLSGYFQPGPEDSDDEEDFDEDEYGNGEDSEDSDDNEDDEELTARSKERLNELVAQKKLEIGNANDDDDDSSSEDDDEDEEEIDAAFIKKMQAAASSKKPPAKASKFAEPASESSEEDSEEDSSSDDDEEEEAPPMKAQKTGSKGTVTPAGKAKQNNSKPNTPATGNKGGKTPQTGGNNKNNNNNNKKRKH